MPGQTHIWRLNRRNYIRYRRLLLELLQEEEWSEPYMVLLDEIKSIPGFPKAIYSDIDTLDVRLVYNPQLGYTGGGIN